MKIEPRFLARMLFVLPALAVGAACSSQPGDPLGSTNAPGAGPSGSQAVTPQDAWRRSMTRASLPKPGCFQTSFPSTTWEEVPCKTTPHGPFVPARGGVRPGAALERVGDGVGDFVSEVLSGSIQWSEGSFPALKHVTSVTDECPTDGSFPSCVTGLGAGQFSLQMNTNTFSTSVCPASSTDCKGWVQFVYTTSGSPEVFMQYWLIDFCPSSSTSCSCPSSPTVTWQSFNNKGTSGTNQWDCWTPFAPSETVFPSPLVTDLEKVVLKGTTGATNTVFMFFPPATLAAQASLDDAVGLNSGDWTETEFNIFGAGNGTEAVFNANASLTVQTLTFPDPYPNQSMTTPTECDSTSFTGETNNRSTYQCWTVPGGSQFTEGPPVPNIAVRAEGLPFNPLAWIDWIDGQPGQPGPPDPNLLPYYAITETSQVLRLNGTSASNTTSSFTPGALSLLAGVAAGTADALVGDDVTEGIVSGTTPLPVLLVDHGTTTVIGALGVANGLVEGVTVTQLGTTPDPPDLRAYDATDATLYSLHIASTGATLASVDAAAALRGVSSITTTPLIGTTPEAPLAFVWNRFTKTLFVVDLAADEQYRHRGKVLRLLTIDPVAGRSRELWRTRDVVDDAPSSAYLSVSARAEVVLALVHDRFERHTEVLVLDATGTPQLSVETEREALLGAPQALPAGVNLPVFAPLRPGIADDVGTQIRLIRREDMRPGLRGAKWLAAHATGALARDDRASGQRPAVPSAARDVRGLVKATARPSPTARASASLARRDILDIGAPSTGR